MYNWNNWLFPALVLWNRLYSKATYIGLWHNFAFISFIYKYKQTFCKQGGKYAFQGVAIFCAVDFLFH